MRIAKDEESFPSGPSAKLFMQCITCKSNPPRAIRYVIESQSDGIQNCLGVFLLLESLLISPYFRGGEGSEAIWERQGLGSAESMPPVQVSPEFTLKASSCAWRWRLSGRPIARLLRSNTIHLIKCSWISGRLILSRPKVRLMALMKTNRWSWILPLLRYSGKVVLMFLEPKHRYTYIQERGARQVIPDSEIYLHRRYTKERPQMIRIKQSETYYCALGQDGGDQKACLG
jgi:hypothetical protein